MITMLALPWLLGPAACRLGGAALRPHLVVPARQLAARLMPGLVLSTGLMCIHAHALSEFPFGALPVVLSAILGGLGYLSYLVLTFAWKFDFLQAVQAAGMGGHNHN